MLIRKSHLNVMIILKLRIRPVNVNDLDSNVEKTQHDLKNEELKEFEFDVYLTHCSSIFETVRAKTLEDAIDSLKKKYPDALDICEADHWR